LLSFFIAFMERSRSVLIDSGFWSMDAYLNRQIDWW
jgi:hypothetical protein